MQSEKIVTLKKDNDEVKVQAPALRSETLDCFSVVEKLTKIHKEPPVISPSLLNYVREDLTSHVTGWPAGLVEKRANKFKQEAYRLGCLQYTNVSAQLVRYRLLVRHTEAKIQEQKPIYVRQQISQLEKHQSHNYDAVGLDNFLEGDILHKEPPVISPSLMNYMRDDLTSHVKDWPADLMEELANMFKQEAYRLGCLRYTKVSAQLMRYRSLVRHTVIDATIEEQKLIYVRQQKAQLRK